MQASRPYRIATAINTEMMHGAEDQRKRGVAGTEHAVEDHRREDNDRHQKGKPAALEEDERRDDAADMPSMPEVMALTICAAIAESRNRNAVSARGSVTTGIGSRWPVTGGRRL